MSILRYFLLIVLISFIPQIFAQQINFSKSFLISASYVNKAELSICKNNLKTAVNYYDSAFAIIKKPFTRDLFNYGLCEKKLGNHTKADSIFKLLYFENFKKQNLAWSFDTTKYYRLKQEEMVKYAEIFEESARILKTDQLADAAKFTDMENYLNTVLSNVHHIMNMVKNAEKDSLNLFSLDNSALYIPIAHFFQLWNISKADSQFFKRWTIFSCIRNVDFKKYGVDDFLIEQTKKGNFDRRVLAHLFSMIGEKFGLRVVWQYNNKYLAVYYPNLFNKKLLSEINNDRKKFGLGVYSDYFIKIRYADSLLTNGKPFTVVTETSENESAHHNSTNFILAVGYRYSLGYHSDQSAWNAYQQKMKEIEDK